MTDYIIGGEILTKRKLVTIDGSMVTTETGIPLALNIVLPNVKAAGADIRLAELDGTPIAREIECVDVPSTDAVMLHYPFDTTTGENSQFYVYWGNANLNEPAEDSTYGSKAVWDAGYKCVHLMNNLLDSTGNGHTLTAYGSPSIVDTNYGKAYDLNGSTQYFSMADSNDWDFGTGNLTFDVGLDIDVVQLMEMLGFRYVHPNQAPLFRIVDSDGYKIRNYIRNYGDIQFGDSVVSTGHNNFAEVRSGNDWMVYYNGTEDDATWATANVDIQTAGIVDIGRYQTGGAMINGRYKYLKISNVARSSNYISTTHKNLNNPTASGTDPFYLSRYDGSQTYNAKSDLSGTESTFLRRTSITRNHTGVLTNYQQKYTIPYHVLMNADFNDFRFNTQADGNGDYLPYWIESQIDSDPAEVWIKSDYASGDDIIYMFYGNDGLSSESSIDDVMIFDDEYTGTTIDTSKWVEVDPATYISQNDKLIISGGTAVHGEVGISSVSTFARPFVFETYIRTDESALRYIGVKDAGNGVSYADFVHALSIHSVPDLVAWEDANNRGNIGSYSIDTDYWLKIEVFSTGAKWYWSTNNKESWSLLYTSSYSSESPLKIGASSYNGQLDIDNTFVRKYSSIEPTYTIGVTKAPDKFSAVSDSDGNVSIFERRKPVKLTHSGVLTDHQHYETFDYEPAMLNNFDDIRFTTQSGEHIPYWIETKTDGVSAKVWFMNDYVDGDTYIWMYYGSEGLTSGSSLDDTMEGGDDFPGSSIDTGKWDGYTTGASVSSGIMSFASDGSNVNYMSSIAQFGPDVVLEMRMKIPGLAALYIDLFGLHNPSQSHKSRAYLDNSGWNRFYTKDGSSESNIDTNWQKNVWGVAKIKVEGGVQTDFYWNDVTRTNSPKTTNPADTTDLEVIIGTKENSNVMQFDWIIIRKYTAVEPTVTVGAEQHLRTGNIMIL